MVLIGGVMVLSFGIICVLIGSPTMQVLEGKSCADQHCCLLKQWQGYKC